MKKIFIGTALLTPFFIGIPVLATTRTVVNKTINIPAIDRGLVGHWSFDGKDMLQNVKDTSGLGNNGNLVGYTSTTTVTGKIGQALTFNGSNQYVNAGSGIPLDSNNWTIHMWLNLSGSLTGVMRFLSYYGDGPTFWNAGAGALSIVHTGTIDQSCNITLVTNKWTAITATRSGSTIRCYLNGAQTVQNTSFSATYTADTSVRIGNSTAFNEPWSGSVDDVRIYNRALSASEVKQLYNANVTAANKTINVPTIDSGLVGHWSFDGKDMTQNAKDTSGQGNTGYLVGYTSTTTSAGKLGQAMRFDGSTQYVNVNDNLSLNPSAITVSSWIKASSFTNAYNTIVHKGDGSNFYEVYVKSNGKLAVYNGNNPTFSQYDGTGTYTLSTNQWYFVTFTYDSVNGLKGYVNGALDGSDVVNGLVGLSSTALSIGRDSWTAGRFFSGSIDDVRIYNRALSSAEVKKLYTASSARLR